MTALPLGMFPTLVESFGADVLNTTRIQSINTLTIERLQADLAAMSAERSDAIEQAVAVHELVDIQREQIVEYQETIDAQRVHIREMEPLANHAAELAVQLAEEGRFCDYFRDEAITNAAHLAQVDDLLSAVGIADGPTLERVSALIDMWLSAESRAQGFSIISGADSRCCNARSGSGAVDETPRGSNRH